jgi:hypothetical protein
MPAPRIVFVVISAVAPAEAVDQLATALLPHTVLVHHDFSQTPNFTLTAPNVMFVARPRRTGWATFGFVEGIFHALQHALEQLEFDYLQLLSPTCLPIKPMAAFEAHVAQGADAHFGAIDLLADRECFMSVGYRAFTPEGTLRHRALRRLSTEYFAGPRSRRDEAGVWIHSGGGDTLRAGLAYALTRLVSVPAVGRHPFDATLRPHYGSVWFGARRPVVRKLVDGFAQPRLRDWASRMRISEEFLIPTLLMQAVHTHGPLNHYISHFEEARPRRLDESDLAALRTSPAFFARKFPDEATARVRCSVLQELVAAPAAPAADAPAVSEPERRPASTETAVPCDPFPVLARGLLPALDP